MAKFTAGPKVSMPTGKLWPCPMNPLFHRQPVVVSIFRGPKKHFFRCGGCTFSGFLPTKWTDAMGLTEAMAVQQGYLVLTSF